MPFVVMEKQEMVLRKGAPRYAAKEEFENHEVTISLGRQVLKALLQGKKLAMRLRGGR